MVKETPRSGSDILAQAMRKVFDEEVRPLNPDDAESERDLKDGDGRNAR